MNSMSINGLNTVKLICTKDFDWYPHSTPPPPPPLHPHTHTANSKTEEARKTCWRNWTDLLSVNQTVAQIKVVEAWKAMNDPEYWVKMKTMKQQMDNISTRTLKPSSVRDLTKGGRTSQAQASFTRDTGKIWNNAPQIIKNTETLAAAKREIKTYCKTLHTLVSFNPKQC